MFGDDLDNNPLNELADLYRECDRLGEALQESLGGGNVIPLLEDAFLTLVRG